MDPQYPTPDPQDEKDLLPLLVLAPNGQGPAEPVSRYDTREGATSLYRSEFGYDVRLEDTANRSLPKTRSGGRRPSGLIAAAFVAIAGVILLMQPGVRTALFTHKTNAPAKAAPSATGGVLALHSTPTPKARTELTGSYMVGDDGSVTTTCNIGAASPGKCVWTIAHPAQQTLNLQMSWTGTATLALNVTDQTGKSYFANSSAASPQLATIIGAPDNIIITVTASNTQATTFTIDATGPS